MRGAIKKRNYCTTADRQTDKRQVSFLPPERRVHLSSTPTKRPRAVRVKVFSLLPLEDCAGHALDYRRCAVNFPRRFWGADDPSVHFLRRVLSPIVYMNDQGEMTKRESSRGFFSNIQQDRRTRPFQQQTPPHGVQQVYEHVLRLQCYFFERRDWETFCLPEWAWENKIPDKYFIILLSSFFFSHFFLFFYHRKIKLQFFSSMYSMTTLNYIRGFEFFSNINIFIFADTVCFNTIK